MLLCLVIAGVTGCESDGGGLGDGHDFGANDPSLYVAMGDSITAAGWPSVLAGKLGQPVVNRGVPGARSDQGAASVNGTLVRYKPGFLLILYGANDVINGGNYDSTIAYLRSMIRAAKANQTIPVIGTLTPMSASHEIWAESTRELSRRIRVMASEERCAVADLERAFGNNPEYILPDGLHPTAAGTERIASVFYGVIR
jgi:lysophospholipase L1-like esterase